MSIEDHWQEFNRQYHNYYSHSSSNSNISSLPDKSVAVQSCQQILHQYVMVMCPFFKIFVDLFWICLFSLQDYFLQAEQQLTSQNARQSSSSSIHIDTVTSISLLDITPVSLEPSYCFFPNIFTSWSIGYFLCDSIVCFRDNGVGITSSCPTI